MMLVVNGLNSAKTCFSSTLQCGSTSNQLGEFGK